MDKNALTEKRRETVIGLLKGMNIKKDENGRFNNDDVYDCMQQLCDLYEKNIEELQNTYESEIVSLKERYAKYDENNELYVSLIMEAKKSSNEIINQAKDEVENILNEGKEKIARQEEELKLLVAGVEDEKAAINEELNATRKAIEAEKMAMQADVDAEREKCIALKNKYSQQMLSMEEEFMDIKTNILRTAGKIDSIKTKLEDEESFAWDVTLADGEIAFPEAMVEVDDTLPVDIEQFVVDEEPEVEAGIEVDDEEDILADGEVALDEVAVDFDIELPEEVDDSVELEDMPIEEEEIAIEDEPEQEIKLEDIFTDIAELKELEPDEEPEIAEEQSEEGFEEISFEGLESLFKED